MNFLPKELTDTLEEYRKIHRKQHLLTCHISDLIFNGEIENKFFCTCNKVPCYNNCPYGGIFNIDLSTSQEVKDKHFFFLINDIDILFIEEKGIFQIFLIQEENKQIINEICIYTGQYSNFKFRNHHPISYFLKLNLPCTVSLKIINLKKYIEKQNSNIIDQGIINIGLNIKT